MRRICSTTLRILALVAAVLSGGLASKAQAELLTPVSVVVRSYEALTDWGARTLWPCCLQKRIKAEGMRYVEVRLRLDVPWVASSPCPPPSWAPAARANLRASGAAASAP